ncbi:hypothetical protein [Parapedobacter sp. DT-150]|uniref:hypothetical protein n=1 Tax=Parapedobacter sp. DT-150 TaxID=3396162 RepID=UPI003F1B048B
MLISVSFARVYALRFYIDRLTHLLSSNTRHGTHSPFIYRLVDEVLYAKRQVGEPADKVKRLTMRLIDRFKPQHVYELGAALPEAPVDFVIADGSDAACIRHELDRLWPTFHPGSVLLVEGIYRNAEMKRLWRAIQTKPQVTVTVNLFHAGLAFFHKGQAKEDFKIRH